MSQIEIPTRAPAATSADDTIQPFEVAALSFPTLWVQVTDEIPEGADAVAGGVFFREAVVEMDPTEARFRFHDPALSPPR